MEEPGGVDDPDDVDHVVGALLRRGERVLLVHRSPARRWYPDVWDVPGGHVEPGEGPAAALVRELREELGIDAAVGGEPFARVGAEDFVMDVWLLDAWGGEPVNAAPHEHDAIAWLTADDLEGLQLAPGVLAQVQQALDGGRNGSPPRSTPCYRDVMADREPRVHQISQRQLRNDSGDVLRRAAAGEVFRIASGDQVVEVRRAVLDPLEALRASGRLTGGNDDDFADFVLPEPRAAGEPSVEDLLDQDRADRW